MDWFTSDLHFGHESIIRMANRPFENADEMNRVLIHNINEYVKKRDRLFILGDVSMHITAEETNSLVKQLHGRKYLLFGNHDVGGNPETCSYNLNLYEWAGYYRRENLPHLRLIMMHYPLLSWDKSFGGSVMLHGHIHSDASYNQKNITDGIRRYDVGVDANNYYPVSLDQIRQWAQETDVSKRKQELL